MAREPRPRRRARVRSTPAGPPAPGPSSHQRIVEAFLRLAAERDFHSIGLDHIAAAADVPLAEFRRLFDGKLAILTEFARQTDESVLAGGAPEGVEAKDRLFEVMMRRFDLLVPHRAAVRRIARAAACDPLLARHLHRLARRSQAWTLAGAGIERAGLTRAVAIEGAVLVYAETLRVFLEDEADLARTMAALDRNLGRGEWAMHWLDRVCGYLPDIGARLRRAGREAA